MKNRTEINTLWVFGDSFTNHTYENCPTRFKHEIIQWPSIISDKYKMELQNFGQVGYSNPQIIHSILCNLSKIKKGDSVVIGFSDPLRILTIKDKKIKTFTNSFYFKTKNDKNVDEKDYYSFKYTKNILIPNEEVIYNFYKEQLIGIEKIVKSMGCYVYIFDHLIWKSFESVTKQTKGKVVDQHWSKYGHEKMANHVLNHLYKNTHKVI